MQKAGTELAGIGRSLNQRINSLSGQSYVTLFFDPADGDPWGFDFEYGYGNAGSVSITRSWYYLLGTW
jgi:hypothetical protein